MMADCQGRSCPRDVVSYNTVIKGFFNEGQVDKAYSLFLEMGVSPNVVTYTTIIDGLCKAQSVDKADGVKPDHDTYNCLIHGYLSTRQWEEVVRRLKEMSTRGLEPDVFTYGLLLDYLCENGNCSEARIFLIL
jgi:leucine-rich PPR motif-containing protein